MKPSSIRKRAEKLIMAKKEHLKKIEEKELEIASVEREARLKVNRLKAELKHLKRNKPTYKDIARKVHGSTSYISDLASRIL